VTTKKKWETKWKKCTWSHTVECRCRSLIFRIETLAGMRWLAGVGVAIWRGSMNKKYDLKEIKRNRVGTLYFLLDNARIFGSN
jgi:hypothetical protein